MLLYTIGFRFFVVNLVTLPTMPSKPTGGKIEALPIELREKAFQLYRRGKSHAQIAEAVGIPRSTIGQWSSRYKWADRAKTLPTLYDQLKQDGLTGNTPEPPGTNESTFGEKQTAYRDRMAAQAVRVAEIVAKMPDAMLLASADKVEKLDKIARKALNLETASPAVVVNIGLLSQGTQSRRAIALPAVQPALSLPSSEPPTSEAHAGNRPETLEAELVTEAD